MRAEIQPGFLTYQEDDSLPLRCRKEMMGWMEGRKENLLDLQPSSDWMTTLIYSEKKVTLKVSWHRPKWHLPLPPPQ